MLLGLAWYWWVLIVIGVIVIARIKVKILGKMMKSRRSQEEPEEE